LNDIIADFLIYWPQRLPAQIISGLILVLFLVGLFATLKQIIRFGQCEFPALDRISRLVGESYKAESIAVDGQQGTRRLVDINELLEGIDRRSRIADRLRIIADMKARHVGINVKTLQEITLAQERASTGMALPPFAVNSAMLLGLLGTFIGLTDMVGTLGGIVGSNVLNSIREWQDAVAGLRTAMTGMNTAFITSLYGMSAAVVLSILGFVAKRKQARFLQELEMFTARDLLPATVLATEEQTLLERATLTIEDAFDHLSAIQTRNNETLASLDGVQKTFLDVVESVRSITADKESRNLDAALSAMGELSSRIPDLVQAIDRTNAALRDGLSELSRRERLDRRMRNLLIRNGFQRIVAAIFKRGAKRETAR
jgi:hypothetical protein